MRTILPKIIDITKNVLEIGASHSPLVDHTKPECLQYRHCFKG